MNFRTTALALGATALFASCALAQHKDNDSDKDKKHEIVHLDHVFVILMENHYLRPDHRQRQRAFYQQLCHNSEPGHELLRRGAPEPDQLPRDRGRLELRHRQRRFAGLAQHVLRLESRNWARPPMNPRPTNTCPIAGQRP